MLLGTLSLFQKRGLFYKELEIAPEDRYSTMEALVLQPEDPEIKPFDIPLKHEMTPVDESGNTDYISATFEDDGNATYPYEVTIWLLVEEVPETY